MKETKKIVLLGSLLSVVFLVLLYLIGAFITWSANPNDWHIGMRVYWVVLGVAAICGSFLIVQDNK